MSYQKWANYPDSPVTTEDYPYQAIGVDASGYALLVMSSQPFYRYNTDNLKSSLNVKQYSRAPSAPAENGWAFFRENTTYYDYGHTPFMQEANSNVYTDSSLTVVYFAQTTPPPTAAILTLVFDKAMADPAGKHAQFGVWKEEESDYQQWENYPQTPTYSLSEYPYQLILNWYGTITLLISATRFYFYMDGAWPTISSCTYKKTELSGGVWGVYGGINGTLQVGGMNNSPPPVFIECNFNILNSDQITTYFSKTTPATNMAPVPLTPLSIAFHEDAADLYQQWDGYPDSPVLTSSYPYQVVFMNGIYPRLLLSQAKLYNNPSIDIHNDGTTNMKYYYYNNSVWNYIGDYANMSRDGSILQTNNDIYYDASFTTTYFTKTTEDSGGPNPLILDLSLAETVADGEVIKLSYTPGTILAADSGVLALITEASVTNGVVNVVDLIGAATNTAGTVITLTFDQAMVDPVGKHGEFTVEGPVTSLYQEWEDYPSTTDLLSAYPKQCIAENATTCALVETAGDLYLNGVYLTANGGMRYYTKLKGETTWTYYGPITAGSGVFNTTTYILKEANDDVHGEVGLTTVYFAKTTSDTVANPVTAAALNADTTKIDLTLTTAITNGQTITASYTKGTVLAASGRALESFTDEAVTNNVVNP